MKNEVVIQVKDNIDVYTTEKIGRYNKGLKLKLTGLPIINPNFIRMFEFEMIESHDGAVTSPCTIEDSGRTAVCVVPDIVLESSYPVYSYFTIQNNTTGEKYTNKIVIIDILDRVKALDIEEQFPDANKLFSEMIAQFQQAQSSNQYYTAQLIERQKELTQLIPQQIEQAKQELERQNNAHQDAIDSYFEEVKKQLAEDPNNFVQQMNDLKASVQANQETITTAVAKVNNMEAGLHESTNEHFTGKYYYDGRKIYEKTIILTGGFAADTWVWSDVLDSSIDDSTVRFLGESTYRISSLVWPLPNYESDVAYVRLHLNRSRKQIGVRAGKNVTGGTAVVIYQYCKKA